MRLIYLSPLAWSSFSQRPHELIRYFHSCTGGEVLWIDPYPTRLPKLADLWNTRPTNSGMDSILPDWLTVVKAKALPIEPVPFSGAVNSLLWSDVVSQVADFADDSSVLGVGKPSELALQLLSKGIFKSSFYDAMDDFPAFYTGWSSFSMARRERRVVRQVSTVLASSTALRDRLKHLARDVRLVHNACASTRLPPALEVRRVNNDYAPVVGYVGTIAQWFDWELVLALAEAHPQAKFRLIGPVYGRPPSSLPQNVSLEAPLPHAQALQAMTQFDVGLIPFKRSSLTISVDPIKYYEYRALGLPVVSSAFGEMALRGESDGVWLIDQHSDMTEVIGKATANRVIPEIVAHFRESNSWESRFNQANIFALQR
jgi:hypothetical protein